MLMKVDMHMQSKEINHTEVKVEDFSSDEY